ncbi:hypothetical protein NPX13_g9133 [Xylaria arbuscula]|uniref:Uncharacterized protein n=1 Tax=Xylaria arbuscula TaxID=114810 RepID=A0A9W8N737_9PEZI|nr:hypothetical protein NPX13_g9133 [Xylaria arbuscula]
MRVSLPPSSGSALFRRRSPVYAILSIFVAAQSVIAAAAGPGDANTVGAAIEAMNAFYNETTGLWGHGSVVA